LLGPVVTVFRPPPYGLTAHHPSARVWNAPVGGVQCFGYPCPPSPLHAGRVNIVVTVGRGARKTLTRRAHTKQPLPAAFDGPPVRRNICATTTTTNSSFSSRSLSLSLSLTLFLSTSMQLSLCAFHSSVRYVCRNRRHRVWSCSCFILCIHCIFRASAQHAFGKQVASCGVPQKHRTRDPTENRGSRARRFYRFLIYIIIYNL